MFDVVGGFTSGALRRTPLWRGVNGSAGSFDGYWDAR